MPLLREILRQDWSPLVNNIAACFLTVLYFKLAIEVAGRCVRWQAPTREFLHGALMSSIVFWPLFDCSDNTWSWRLNAILPAAMMARFFYKGAILKDPEDMEVQTISRSSSPSELLSGPMQCAAILIWLGLYHFLSEEAAIIAAAVGIGDGLAPIIGKWYGRHVYQMPLAGTKTMEGTVVGVFLGTVFGCYLYLSLLGIPVLPLRIILVYGGIAAVVEGTSLKGLDNLAVPVALHLSMAKVKEMMPA